MMMRTAVALLSAALLLACSSASDEGIAVLPVHGRVFVPEGVSLAQAEVWLQLASGRRLVSFPLPDGAFSFADVPAGVHTLTIEHSSLVFPSVRLDVGEGRHGRIVANAADVPGNPALPYPLLVRPMAFMEYFEKRQPFSVMSFLKTPYGMMAGFMVFSMFILPKLKIDPEEEKDGEGEQAPQVAGSAAAKPAAIKSSGGGGRRRDD